MSKDKTEKPKTITDQLVDIAEEICDHYCKHPDKWHGDLEDLAESEICKNCPLHRLNG